MTGRHVSINRDYWNGNAGDWVAAGERLWAAPTPEWGFWGFPEAGLEMLPSDMSGLRTIELGCGTGYVSGWMTKRGAVATGVDVSAEQLATARRLAGVHGAEITFIEGNAESVPLPDGSFDFAISEYGAAIWCDPDLWIPEAHRLLAPRGRLVFMANHPLAYVGTPPNGDAVEPVFHRPYRGMNSVDWTDALVEPGGVEFNRTIGDWFALFRRTGFDVEDYREVYAPDDATGVTFAVPADWGRQYPAEQVWKLRKR